VFLNVSARRKNISKRREKVEVNVGVLLIDRDRRVYTARIKALHVQMTPKLITVLK